MRQCEFKKRYDPEMDTYVRRHIYGEGIMDTLKSVGKKFFGKTAKSIAKTAATKAATTAATKTGEYAGKKAGDKIVKLLSRNNKNSPASPRESTSDTLKQIEESIASPPRIPKLEEMNQQEINERVNQILSGGKLRRRNFI